MVRNICDHTNSYAIEHISDGTHRYYAQSDGSWKETTPDEINRLIALLIYFGLVKVHTNIDRYWSIKSLYHGLWAWAIKPRIKSSYVLITCCRTSHWYSWWESYLRCSNFLMISNPSPSVCISPDNMLPLMNEWLNQDTGLVYVSISKTNLQNGV